MKQRASMNEYDIGKGTPDIKSMLNTLDFEYGAGPLAMINPKLDKLLV